jgi:hypothetical protein
MPKRKLEKQSTTLAPVALHILASACFDWLLLSFICFAAAGETPALVRLQAHIMLYELNRGVQVPFRYTFSGL